MRKNYSLIAISILIVVIVALLIFIISNKLEDNKNKKYISSTLSTEIMKIENEKEITYVIEDYERKLTYSWTFKKDEKYTTSVKDSLVLDINLRLKIIENYEDSVLKNKVSNEDKLIISFDHHGELPTKATVRIQVSDRFKNGKKLYLYYYNEEEDQIEYIQKGLKVKSGYVEFEIEHCSDYLLTGSIIQEAVNNPKNINVVIIVMVIVIGILIATTLFQNKK